MNLFLVGGAVRDLLLGVEPHDLDYTFQGSIDEFLQQCPTAKRVGSDHSVYIYHGHEYSPLVGDCIADDLMNRDFTFNALALTESGHLYHHPRALEDLQKHIFRAASDTSFLNDPNRVFRLARFTAQYPEWTISEETEALLFAFPAKKLATISPERVSNELLKAFQSSHPERFFTFLARYRLLSPWFQELEEAETIPAGPPAYHAHSVFGHTMRVLQAVHGDPVACWMALCHDLGKILTPKDVLPHHYRHEVTGIVLAESLAERLIVPRNFVKAGKIAVAEHMLGGRYPYLRIGTRRDLLWRIAAQGFHEPFWKLVDADSKRLVSAAANEELRLLKAVRLPKEFQNCGIASQEKLRELHCMALTKSPLEQIRKQNRKDTEKEEGKETK